MIQFEDFEKSISELFLLNRTIFSSKMDFMKKVKNMYRELSALVWKENKLFVAKSVEVEVASQGNTKQEALANLKEALELYFRDEPAFNLTSSFKNLSLEKIGIRYA